MALELVVPSVGESVSEVEIGDWLKQPGDPVRKDEAVVVLETDKATVEIYAPADGTLTRQLKTKGEKVKVGEVVGLVEPGAAPVGKTAPPAADAAPTAAPGASPPSAAPPPRPAVPEPRVMPAAARAAAQAGLRAEEIPGTGPGGRVLKEDVERAAAAAKAAPPAPAPAPEQPAAVPAGEPAAAPAAPAPARGARPAAGEHEEEVVPMSLLRRKIAERLVQAQNTMALLTTFNEADLSAIQALRAQFQEAFQARYQVKLGLMSFFVKATIEALKEVPALNAEIRGTDIVYRNYFDIGIAIGGGRGLVVPVLRQAERLSFAEIELAIADFARRAKENKLRPDELVGGTFTITNGGVYGSLLSTPLINPPQSGVLGMHAIQDRPVARDGQVVIRPMMYLALTYDHRLVDGREAVTFLRRVKDLVENPARMLLEV
jgi:2-oxoglutarate dehydrogenase E2 component (dihydrolipoamide succinyltransferase)